jgi:hypothetical protein
MKSIVVLLVLGALGYFIYNKYERGGISTSTEGYSLRMVAEKPVPKDVFFALFTQEALSKCADARGNYNLSPSECQEKISAKARVCTTDAIKNAPKEIDSPQLVKSLGRPYLECVTPYFHCNGVEVKSEGEARHKCQ